MRYALIDQSGTIVNNIAWDGVSPYTPPNGMTLAKIEDSDASVLGIGVPCEVINNVAKPI